MGWVGANVAEAARAGELTWVRLDADGTVGARGATPIDADHVATLGAATPVIVDGTPYGREALLAEALRTTVDRAGADPLDGLGLVHDADFDEYRLTLLVEAARLAGVPADKVVLVPRGDDEDESRRAAAVASAMLSAGASGTGAATAAGIGGGAGVVGGAILGSHLLQGGGTAAAAGTAAGPAGAALSGPTGTALSGPTGQAIAGPTGQAAAGPAGQAIAGPTGQAAAGPTGQAIAGPAGQAAAGPMGQVIVPVAQVATKAKWLPILGGTAVGVAAIAGIAVVATRGEDEPAGAEVTVTVEAEPAATTVGEPPDGSPPPSTVVTTRATTIPATTTEAPTTTTSSTTTTTTTVAPTGDFTALLGSWQTGCIEESGGSVQVIYTLSGSSPDALNLHAAVTAWANGGCSGASQSYADAIPATVTGTTVVDGLPTFRIHTADGNGIMAADGDTLYIGAFDDTVGYPTAFDPMWTCTRV